MLGEDNVPTHSDLGPQADTGVPAKVTAQAARGVSLEIRITLKVIVRGLKVNGTEGNVLCALFYTAAPQHFAVLNKPQLRREWL